MADERCPVCDRAECKALGIVDDSGCIGQRGCSCVACKAHTDCSFHRIDWRSRCLKAEQEASALRQERDAWKEMYQSAENALADRNQQIAALRDELKDLRAAMFNIAVATIRDPRGAVMPQDVVSAVVDVAANRQWLLDEHVPSLQTRIDAIEAEVIEQVAAYFDDNSTHVITRWTVAAEIRSGAWRSK